ncbi:MAG: hypothetical protein ACYTEZ_11315 [Planctomycetota bacterium]
MRRSRLTIATVGALLLAAGVARAKPVTIHYDRAFDTAWLAAEVEVLAVEVGAWMAWGGPRGNVRIRVTSDPERIYRGLRHLGRTFELRPSGFSAQSCTRELKRYERSEQRVLLVVDTGRTIVLGGEAVGDGYLLRGWCDHNSCLLRSSDAAFGGEILPRERGDQLSLARSTLIRRYREPRREFCARVTRLLAGERPALSREEVGRWIRDLGARRPERRAAAQRLLRARAHLHVGTLREAARTARDPEVRRRLHHALAGMREQVDAFEVAQRLNRGPLSARLYVAREGVAALNGSALRHAQAYLRALEAFVADD